MKLIKLSSVLLGFSVVFSAFPAVSGGSMAVDSRVIIVRPAPEIRRQAEIRQREKAKIAAEKSEAKADAAAEKSRQKAWDAETKIYKKRLADQAKKRKK